MFSFIDSSRFAADTGSRWASLDSYGRTARPLRCLSVWSADDLDDDRQQSGDDAVDEDSGQRHEDGVLSESQAGTVQEFDGTPTGQSPVSVLVSPDTGQTLTDSVIFQTDGVAEPDGGALTWCSDGRDVAVGRALAARASSDGDVLAGVESVEAAARRSSRLLSSASAALFGRFVARRQRLTTVSGADWRGRRRGTRRQQPVSSSSNSFYDDCSGRLGVQTATGRDNEIGGEAACGTGPMPSLSASVDWSHQRSHRRVTNTPSSSSAAARPGGHSTPLDTATSNHHELLQRTRSSSKQWQATVQRYPSVERLDQPRLQQSAALAVGDRTAWSAERKRAERFRRQYTDVKLHRQATRLRPPTETSSKSMPTGVNMCGRTTTHRDVV